MIKTFNCDCLDLINDKEFSKVVADRELVIITDPPFNIGYHYNEYKDKMKENEYLDMLQKVLMQFNSPFVVIHYPEMLCKIACKTSVMPTKIVSWVYNSNTAKQHRDIGFFKIKPDFTKVLQPYKNPNDKRIKARIAKGIGGGAII